MAESNLGDIPKSEEELVQELDLPSTRLTELETLLRQREQENERLAIEVTALRKHLAKEPPSATPSENFTLPPALLSLVLPYLTSTNPLNSSNAEFDGSGGGRHHRFSENSVTIALTQRAKQLQDENDELYELLKHGETGRLKEEVRALRQVLRKMERGLTESHGIINSLSTELERCYEVLLQFGVTSDNYPNSGARRTASRAGTPVSAEGGGSGGGNVSGSRIGTTGKPIPTGPRAQKRPRMSSARVTSPSPQPVVSKGPSSDRRRSVSVSPRRNTTNYSGSHGNINIASTSSRGGGGGGGGGVEVDMDDTRRLRRDSPGERRGDRDRDRVRDRDKGKDYPSRPPRDWDRGGNRRNVGGRERDRRGGGGGGGGGGGSGGGGGGGSRNSRGLVERLGLHYDDVDDDVDLDADRRGVFAEDDDDGEDEAEGAGHWYPLSAMANSSLSIH